MLKGQGTVNSPLFSRPMELMDINYVTYEETNDPGFVLIIKDTIADELFSIIFNVKDFKELVFKGVGMVEGIDGDF